jgi:hypothetical protein
MDGTMRTIRIQLGFIKSESQQKNPPLRIFSEAADIG